ncbi:Gfo/Idh/MocA family oxidoreductase [Candidatus Woesearchaeota archaeon]|nr:Gfo/Idh/MocA family oxidoreductase [Candidatus Woesearchaeota archaeon]
MKLGIIGAGECFRDKMLPALQKIGNFQIPWIIDVKPEAGLRAYLAETGFKYPFAYHETGRYLVDIPSDSVDVVIDATPSRYRAQNTALSLAAGKHVYAEKPFTINQDGIAQVEAALKMHPGKLAYFAEYSRDEKGLPLRALTGEFVNDNWYAQFIFPGLDAGLLKALHSIGDIREITGTWLEGSGKKSGISHRLWVGDQDQGGQLLDMSTHLFTYLPLFKNKIGSVTIDECVTGICREFQEEYKERTGKDIAETYAEVRLKSEHGFPIRFAFGKYTGVAERVLNIEGRNGFIYMDFETQIMAVNTPAYTGMVQAVSVPKYIIIMSDLFRRLQNPALHQPYQFDNSKETLELILSAKAKIDPERTIVHEAGNIPTLSAFLSPLRRLPR